MLTKLVLLLLAMLIVIDTNNNKRFNKSGFCTKGASPTESVGVHSYLYYVAFGISGFQPVLRYTIYRVNTPQSFNSIINSF